MTTPRAPHAPSTPRGRTARRLALHYVEMVVAMLVGMAVLAPLWPVLAPGLPARTDVHAVTMATDMALGMAAWMRFRRHSWSAIVEMCAAMYAPFLVLLVPYWTGHLSGAAVLSWGHLLMLPAMAVPMVRSPYEYAGCDRPGSATSSAAGRSPGRPALVDRPTAAR